MIRALVRQISNRFAAASVFLKSSSRISNVPRMTSNVMALSGIQTSPIQWWHPAMNLRNHVLLVALPEKNNPPRLVELITDAPTPNGVVCIKLDTAERNLRAASN
ncbi:hypothetical protein ACA910_016594 [Epithemia clementina (nom. ined.)]